VKIRDIFLSLIIIILTIIVVILSWENTLLAISLLLLLSLFKHRVMPIKKELLWFFISGIIGSGAESISMLSGPWSYANHGILNIPLWLPLLWGLAGILGVSLYKGITQTK